MNKFYDLYDTLISHIPDSLTVDNYLVGAGWIYVRSENSIGLARTVNEARFRMEIVPENGMPLKQLARAIHSWNYLSAGLGLAAINAAFNNGEYLRTSKTSWEQMEYTQLLDNCREQIRHKKVSFIDYPVTKDHPLMKHAKAVSILKQEPEEGDYPFPAAAYILPEQDCIFIAGTSMINKTLPRLLALPQGTPVILAGLDIPAGFVQDSGYIDQIITFIVTDPEQCMELIRRGESERVLLDTGYFVRALISKER